MAKAVRRIDLPERFDKQDDRYAMYALVAETVGVYYWCEAFVLRGFRPRKFCLLGQRGLVEYAAKKVQQVYNLIQVTAAQRNETIGWQYGAIISLRDALHAKRKEEILDPIYNEHMMAAVYRARHDLKTAYRVGGSDARAVFDIAGFDRGRTYPWVLKGLLTPMAAMSHVKENPERYKVNDAKD